MSRFFDRVRQAWVLRNDPFALWAADCIVREKYEPLIALADMVEGVLHRLACAYRRTLVEYGGGL